MGAYSFHPLICLLVQYISFSLNNFTVNRTVGMRPFIIKRVISAVHCFATAELHWPVKGKGEKETFNMIMQISTENRFLKRSPTWPTLFEMSVTTRRVISQQLCGAGLTGNDLTRLHRRDGSP